MKKGIVMFVILMFLVTIAAPVFAAATQAQVDKLQNEITVLEKKLTTTKSSIQRARIQSTIKGHQAKIAEMQKDLPPVAAKPVKLEITKVEIVQQSPKTLSLKGGLAGGAGLIAVDYMMPVGPMMLGGEAGYAIGNQFGIVDAGIKGVYPIGAGFVGLEVSYAGYSKDVKEVPGLSGTIKSGVGIGLIGGAMLGPVRIGAGYNTALGLRADAGYVINL